MVKWFITEDWSTPSRKHVGGGTAKDWDEACAGVKAWIRANIPQLSSHPYWRFVKLADGSGTVIDFGSHSVFAKLLGKEPEP